jgi:hypothetical protein
MYSVQLKLQFDGIPFEDIQLEPSLLRVPGFLLEFFISQVKL